MRGSFYNRKAADLLSRVKYEESQQEEGYDQYDVSRATVYTRQDLILVVSHLESLNLQLRWVRILLVVLTVAQLANYF
jgi:hypothetical protein